MAYQLLTKLKPILCVSKLRTDIQETKAHATYVVTDKNSNVCYVNKKPHHNPLIPKVCYTLCKVQDKDGGNGLKMLEPGSIYYGTPFPVEQETVDKTLEHLDI